MPVPFENRTVHFVNEDGVSGKTNPETWSLMKDRFVVLRNFIPKEIINMTLDSWKTVESNPKWDESILYREMQDITSHSPKNSIGKSKAGYCTPWGVAMHRWLKDALDTVIDMQLRETYSYTRKYDRGAYLTSHLDRPSCEISATICLDYKSDDNTPWKIWVQNDRDYVDETDREWIINNTQNVPIRKRNSIAVSLEVGDVLLYQGPNIPHWRDTFLGEYSYHIFLHFYNNNSRIMNIPSAQFARKDWLIGNGRDVPVLEFDGRRDRYSVKEGESEYNKRMQEFSEEWNQIPNKTDLANAYEGLTRVEKKGK